MGRATAEQWARAGAHVLIADLQQDGSKLAEDLRKDGYLATYVYCDVTSYRSQVDAFKTAISATTTKTLDVVVMFAGVGAFGGRLSDQISAVAAFLDNEPPFPPAGKVVEVNLIGTYYTTYLALHYLRLSEESAKSPAGSLASKPDKALIFVSSMTAYMDYEPHPVYSASKFGTRGLFRSIRQDTKQLSVRCSLIAPWYVDTSMTAAIKHAAEQGSQSNSGGIQWTQMSTITDCLTHCAIDPQTDGKANQFIRSIMAN